MDWSWKAPTANALYPYQNSPRLVWIVNALQDGGLKVQEQSLEKLDNQWTAMSGQMSDK